MSPPRSKGAGGGARDGSPVRIVIVDDHPLVREGLAARISTAPGFEICGQAAGAEEARTVIAATAPTLVVLDLALHEGHGLDLIKRIRGSRPDLKILIVSAFDETMYAERALRAGAQGYVNKREVSGAILEAIRTVLRGDLYLSPAMSQRLAQQAIGSRSHRQGVDALSDRELEVMSMIGAGRSTREIAAALHLSPHTIESHREKIRQKLGLRNGTELVQYAVQWTLQIEARRNGDSAGGD